MDTESQKLSCDLLIVGGGINGAGIARDAAGRGLSVILCEKDDLASHTSSASSKLIHGGLRYLEYYEFGLVRKALIEREILMRMAPHIISPIRFVMPHVNGLRPRWLLRLALFLYDHLATRELLAGTESVLFRSHETGNALQPYLTHGLMYSDAWVDDARLVILNAMDARERGALILTHTSCESLQQFDGRWQARLSGSQSISGKIGAAIQVDAAMVVNATGSWASQFQRAHSVNGMHKNLRLVKGSHIVVKRLFSHEKAYIFQHPDGRIVFATPFQNDFTLIGTTDIEYQGDIDVMQISHEEIDYLCALSNRYFSQSISAEEVIWSYSGVRPLVDDGKKDAKSITRDYQLELEPSGAPMLHVFGGKITTYRRLAEDALELIAPVLNCRQPSWTAKQSLPGGDLLGLTPHEQTQESRQLFFTQCEITYPWLPKTLLHRLMHNYGTRIHRILVGCQSMSDLGACIAEGLYERELLYLIDFEFARTAQDILWRRTKLGLHLPTDAERVLENWLVRHSVTS